MSRMPLHAILAAIACWGGSALPSAYAAQPAEGTEFVRKLMDVPVIATPLRIDGRLDDAAWRDAAIVADLTQFAPGDGAAPTEPTEFLLMRDANFLYVGARMHDSDPRGIKHSRLVQGEAVVFDDYVQVILDPYNSRRTGYMFYVNPNGVQRDGLLIGGNNFNMDWDGIWEADARIDDAGWVAEIAIPFKTLSFDPANDRWGVNLVRSIRRKGEELVWSQENRRITLDAAGEMSGFRGVRQGRGLDVVPSYTLTERRRFALDQSSIVPKPSLDVFYRFTPSLTGALTLNTDFSATEVDDRQVNLTRFSLFFPEKRDFFLEDAQIFEFGGLAQNGRPFFSRTIGLSAAGQPIDLDGGVKLTGRVGRFNIGTLAVRQEASGAVDARDLFVARAQANIGEQSYVGAILTSGDPTSNRSNTLAGIDANLRTRRLVPGEIVEGKLWMQRSRTDGVRGDDAAYGASLAYPSDRWDAFVGVTTIQDQFRPAMGFVNRVGIRQYDARAKRRVRFRNGFWRSWRWGFDGTRIDDRRGALESRLVTLTPLILESQTSDTVTLEVKRDTEVLVRPFVLPGGLRVPSGRYEFDRVRANVTLAPFRKLSPTLEVEAGDFYDGRRVDTKVGLQWRPNEHLFLNGIYTTNTIDLPAGRFTARVYSLAGNVAFNVHWAWLNVVQYDNVSRRLGVNSRLRWLPTSSQSVYFVVNHDWSEGLDGTFRPAFNETALKLGYTFRY